MNKKSIFLIVTLFVVGYAKAGSSISSPDTIVWKVQQALNTTNDDILEFILHEQSNRVSWFKPTEGRRYNFTSTAVEGACPAQADSEVTYLVTCKRYTGKITFRRQGNTLEALTEFVLDEVNTTPFVFRVSTIETR
jgi:hypothetical protein